MENISQNISPLKEEAKSTSFFFEAQTKNLKSYFKNHPENFIGCRIIFVASIGTVRYFGPLCHEGKPQGSQKELWIGIEWDDQKRGKHNGSINGYKYFQCSENKGSMVKFEKIEFGYKLETGLFKRYFRAEEIYHAKSIYDQLDQIKSSSKTEEEKKIARDQLGRRKPKIQFDSQSYVETLRKNKVMVQFIGFDQIWNKIHNLDKVQNISLAQSQICDLGPQGNLKKIFPNLTTLSLQQNLLFDWNQILLIGHELEHLTELSVASNKLREPRDLRNVNQIEIMYSSTLIDIQMATVFKKLKSLVLINTESNWRKIFKVLPAFNLVEELILCKNDMTDTQNIFLQNEDILKNLRFLNLEQTNLDSFQGIKKFRNLKSLSRLILNKNKLKNFGIIDGFKELKSLSLEANLIDHPYAISELSKISSLQYFNIKHNPISNKMGNGYVRQRSVAQFPKLIYINGADLKKYERKDCQIFYLRQTFAQYFNLRKVPDYDYDFQDFTKWSNQHHPRITALIKIYGNPFQPQKKQIVAIIKQDNRQLDTKKPGGMIQVKIIFRGGPNKDQTQFKKIPLSWTLSSLKNLFSKTMKIPVKNLKLSFRANQHSEEEPLNQDHKLLAYYFNSKSIIYFDIES